MRVHTTTKRNRYIHFRDHNGEQRSLKCGKVGLLCHTILRHVTHLVNTRKHGRPCSQHTIEWLNDEGYPYAEQLRQMGLVRVQVFVD